LPHHASEQVTIHHGDCLDVMRELADNSIDAIVCDPPYSLGFMGREWDTHNEDEDAAFAYWLAGFVDGEGCFRVQRHERGTYTCTFAIKVRRDERGTLERIQRFLGGIGHINDGDGSGNAHPQSTYTVGDKTGCLRLVRLFDKYPLRAKKRLDYEPWAQAVVEWNNMKRGHRWTGRADWSRMADLKARVERTREYVDPPWSGDGYQDWCRMWAAECLRVLKPGGHLLSFGGARTWHRLAVAIEDAGFEIRDSIAWLYGSGFPKSMDVAKAIDKATPGADEAADWQGWGTALKPAFEPIVVGRKPLVGTVATNVLAHGTGALNIDATRVTVADADYARNHSGDRGHAGTRGAEREGDTNLHPGGGSASAGGRWPTNVLLTHADGCEQVGTATERVGGGAKASGGFVSGYERGDGFVGADVTAPVWACAGGCPVGELDRQAPAAGAKAPASGATYSGASKSDSMEGAFRGMGDRAPAFHADQGGASRFFPVFQYVAKAPTRERPSYVDESGTRIVHATVKPLALMRWLIRLVAAPGAVVLDPFAGSGTTIEAAVLEGVQVIGIEREADYLPLIDARLARVEDAA